MANILTYLFLSIMAKLEAPIIITFANQKGGVGKTTLCTCFANYLISMGVHIKIYDCDRQQSIARNRKRDIKKYGDSLIPYAVEGYRNVDRDKMREIISDIYEQTDCEIILFDCPGNITESWLIPLFANSDIIAIPFHYDDVTIASTSEFFLFVERINSAPNINDPARLFMIPNISDKRIGTFEELRRWEETREKYESHGTVTPKVSRKADMERISTIADLDKQLKIVKPAFDKIYYDVFGNTRPLRKACDFVRSKEKTVSKKSTSKSSDSIPQNSETLDENNH